MIDPAMQARLRRLEDDLDNLQALAGTVAHCIQRTRQELDDFKSALAGQRELPVLGTTDTEETTDA